MNQRAKNGQMEFDLVTSPGAFTRQKPLRINLRGMIYWIYLEHGLWIISDCGTTEMPHSNLYPLIRRFIKGNLSDIDFEEQVIDVTYGYSPYYLEQHIVYAP